MYGLELVAHKPSYGIVPQEYGYDLGQYQVYPVAALQVHRLVQHYIAAA